MLADELHGETFAKMEIVEVNEHGGVDGQGQRELRVHIVIAIPRKSYAEATPTLTREFIRTTSVS